MTGPTREDVERAMLDSLIDSFQMADDTGRLIVSMNFGDIADMLHQMRQNNAALRERLEAAEAGLSEYRKEAEHQGEMRVLDREALTESLAREAVAWEAGATAMGSALWGHADDERFRAHNLAILRAKDRLTPPTDAAAALTARLDAARDEGWNAAIEAAAGEVGSLWAFRTCRQVTDAIRALRREKEGNQ